MNLKESLQWRYAVQAFDAGATVSQSDIEEIIDVFRLSPSSFGLQPWKLVVIQDKKLQQDLVPVTYNQAKIADASALLVLAYIKNIDESHALAHFENTARTTGATLESLEPYKNSLLNFVNNTPEDIKNSWAKNQVYLAAGVLVAHLAAKRIDACCMEGFSPEDYDRILWLDQEKCSSAVIIPIGKRDASDPFGHTAKTRFSAEEVTIYRP